jgi:hypothetical protein
MKEVFIKNLLKKSHSQDYETAKLEWEYERAIKLYEPELSPSFDQIKKKKVINNSVLFWNRFTNQYFHAGTSNQYYIQDKGTQQSRTKNQDPNGNGTKNNNFKYVRDIFTSVTSCNKSNITPVRFKNILKYKKIVTEINMGEDVTEILDNIELFLLKWQLITCKRCQVETIINNKYKYEYCPECYSAVLKVNIDT